MAAAVHIVIRLVENETVGTTEYYSAIRRALNDLDDTAGVSWIEDYELYEFAQNHIIQSNTTLQLTKKATGVYTCNQRYSPAAILLNTPAAPFTGDADVTYYTYTRGPSVRAYTSGGTTPVDHSSDTISLSGAVIDFNEMMFQLLTWLASYRAMSISQTYSTGSITPSEMRRELLDMAATWRGIKGA